MPWSFNLFSVSRHLLGVSCFIVSRRKVEAEHECHGIQGGFLEAVAKVEGFGLIGNGMDQQGSDTDLRGDVQCSAYCILEQPASEA